MPAKVRKKLRLGPDSRLEWIIEGNTVRVIPLPSDSLKAFRGSGAKGLVRKLLNERNKDRSAEDAK